MNLNKKTLTKWAGTQRSEFETALEEFVEIPTVSSDPSRSVDIRRCAELAVETIRKFGGKAEILETDGYPLIHGRFTASHSAPTVTVYNHIDVQPASKEKDTQLNKKQTA